MAVIPKAVTRLVDEFSRLPGIGPKTASRLTYYLLRAPSEQVMALGNAVTQLKEQIKFCSRCFNIAESDPCPVCTDPQRDIKTICVIEEPLDLLAIERVGGYQGLYHVLHGAISPVDGIGPDELRIRELVERAQREPISEVILATNPSLEGEATAMYIRRQLLPLDVRVTRLARGLPVGGDLEYADSITLARALEGRQDM
ncbi:MAG: recombination protein RecR [Anaerolineae bacterium]|nr:recombination protein RecR [Anaerolineae bacterium]